METLQLHERFLKQYHDHPNFGTDFRTWCAQAKNASYLDRADDDTAPAAPPRVAPVEAPNEEEREKKRIKLEAAMIPIADMPATIVHSIAIPKTKAEIVVAVGHLVYISSKGTTELKLGMGTVVSEFYKGKWSDSLPDGKEGIMFKLTDSEEFLKNGTRFQTVNTLITERQKTKFDEAKIRYREMTALPKPGLPTHFTLKHNQDCYLSLIHI